MNLTNIFVLPDGRLRAGWRLLLFVIFFVVAIIVFQGAAALALRRSGSGTAILAVSTLALLAAVCTVTWLMMHLIEHQPFSGVGLAMGRPSLREAAWGVVGGAGFVSAIAAIEWSIGAIHFQSSGTGTSEALVAVASGAGIFVISAANEELLFRGYPFQRVVEGTNGLAAVVLMSILFGGLHWRNPHSTRLALANTILAGVFLSLAYLKTRALWLPIGFHFSWNWTLSLMGLQVSGLELGSMPWRAMPSSSHLWVHGGDYGPEGGVIATAVLLVGIVYLYRTSGKTSLIREGEFSSPENSLSHSEEHPPAPDATPE